MELNEFIRLLVLFLNILIEGKTNLLYQISEINTPIVSTPSGVFFDLPVNNNESLHNILKLTSIFENSNPELQWGYCENIHDGRGFTCGVSGFCSGTGDMVQVFEEYCNLKPDDVEAADLYEVLKGTDDDNVAGLDNLSGFFNNHANDQIFREAQIIITNKLYVSCVNNLVAEYNLKLPISIGQMFDTCTNHGESGAVKIAKKAKGDNEKDWLKSFLNKRYNVLKNDDTWSSALDRINVYKNLLEKDNTNLNSPIHVECYGDTFNF